MPSERRQNSTGLDSLYSLVDLGNTGETKFTPLGLSILDLFLHALLQPLHLVECLLTVGLVTSLFSPETVHLGFDLASPVISTW